jgi:hypothetical protein
LISISEAWPEGLFVYTNPRTDFPKKEKTIMAITPIQFVNTEVLQFDFVAADSSRHKLFIVDGIVIINFSGANDDFLRDTLTFKVPHEGATNPADPASALPTPGFEDSVVNVFPASAQSTGGDIIGWAVDEVDTVFDGANVVLTANLAIRGYNTTLFRVGYHVTIETT